MNGKSGKKNIIRVSLGDLAKKTDNVGTPPLERWKLSERAVHVHTLNLLATKSIQLPLLKFPSNKSLLITQNNVSWSSVVT